MSRRMVALLGAAQGTRGGAPVAFADEADGGMVLDDPAVPAVPPGDDLRAVVAEVRAAAALTASIAEELRRR